MAYPLYNLLLGVATPFVRHRLASRPSERPLLGRFEAPAEAPTGPIWVQACSVGEVNTAVPLVDALREACPSIPVLVTASTTTGHERAQACFGEENTAWFPFDTCAAVGAFFDVVQPRMLVLVETELWPNVIAEAERRGVPVVIVNGRLSDKHFARYRRARWVLAGMFRALACAGMQSEAHAHRLINLGVTAERVSVTGNLKYDAARVAADSEAARRLRTEYGFASNDPVLVFGSTRPGDEALAKECWDKVRDEIPHLRIILAPRHLDRVAEATAPFGDEAVLRSELKRHRPSAAPRVIVVDTHGELVDHYALATLAVVCGSFYPGADGHNPLEAAGLGVPVVFGPHMKNFQEIAEDLLRGSGAEQIAAEIMPARIRELLIDPGALARRGTAARRTVLEGQGATRKNVAMITEVLNRSAKESAATADTA